MAGYNWDPVVRIVPRNGSERVVVFADAFSDLRGHEKADVRYVLDQRTREDVNRVDRRIIRGWRPEVRFDFAILTMADQHNLAEVEEALADPLVDVYLAMDACTFRRIVLAGGDGPDPLAGKPFVGARFRATLRGAELLTERPRMGETTNPAQRELLQNGGLEQWGGGLAQSWGYAATAGGTISQDSVNQRSGASCVAFARSGAGTLENGQTQVYGLEIGLWYTLASYAKGSAPVTNGHRIYIRNETRSTNISSDGKTWGATNLAAVQKDLATGYALGGLTFRVSADFSLQDRYAVYLLQNNLGVGQTCYFDDCSLLGPVLPSGVSLW